MSNRITIELCAEDRARIDRLTAALERRAEQTEGTKPDDIQEALKAQLAKSEQAPAQSPVEPAEATEAETPATVHPAEESLPWEEPAAVAEAKPAPTVAELQQKVIALVNKGKKAAVSAIVKSYAATVSGIPEDKRAECMSKLNALEE